MKSNTRRHNIIIIVLVLINAATLFFLFKSHRPPFGKRPPSMTEMFDITGPSAEKIVKLENHHFELKTKLVDKNGLLRKEIFNQLKNGASLADTDSLLTELLKNEKTIEIETITFFVQLQKLIPSNKKTEVDEIINHVLSGRPGPPPRK